MASKDGVLAVNLETHFKNQSSVSKYEQSREQRIRENQERMKKLGLFDLSLKFKSVKPNRGRKPQPKLPPSPLPPPQPARRSSRLQNATPVSYTEIPEAKKSLHFKGDLLEAGSKPEIYTEEHEKLLGSTEMSWTLFVDGYGKDGKRIYDQVRGKTCHQCRQKTLGHHTQCSKCDLVQGQFCGDCLFMRYGEHVLEAIQNPDWICPPCRGICNCSLCRQARGWAPTGILYKKITRMGYKSVAHFLIQTHRAKTDEETTSDVVTKESSEACNETQAEEKKANDEPSDDKEPFESPGVLSKPCSEHDDKTPEVAVNVEPDRETAVAGVEVTSDQPELSPSSDKNHVCPAESTPAKHIESVIAPETSSRSKRKRVAAEPIPDSIAGRLRQRRAKTSS